MAHFQYVGKNLVKRLTTRFALSLSESKADSWQVPPTVQAITDADKLLVGRVLGQSPDIAVTANGFYLFDTVPLGEVRRYQFLQANVRSGTFNLNGFDMIGGGTDLNLLVTTHASHIHYYPSNGIFTADQGWKMYFKVDALAASGVAYVTWLYEKEDAY